MPISVTCPCGKTSNVRDDLAGAQIRCPACRNVLDVPEIAAQSPAKAPAFEVVADDPLAARAEMTEASQPLATPATPSASAVSPRPLSRPPVRKPARQGWFGSTDAGVAGGIGMIVIAVIFFVVGLLAGAIWIYPPILAVVGVIAVIKGLAKRE